MWSALTCQRFSKRRLVAARLKGSASIGPRQVATLKAATSRRTPHLLLRGAFSPGLVATVTAPNSIQAVRLNLVGDKTAALPANSYGDVVALLDAHAVGVIAPNKSVEIAGGLDGQFRFVFFAVGILAGRVVVSCQT